MSINITPGVGCSYQVSDSFVSLKPPLKPSMTSYILVDGKKQKNTNTGIFPGNCSITSTGNLLKALKNNDDKPL